MAIIMKKKKDGKKPVSDMLVSSKKKQHCRIFLEHNIVPLHLHQRSRKKRFYGGHAESEEVHRDSGAIRRHLFYFLPAVFRQRMLLEFAKIARPFEVCRLLQWNDLLYGGRRRLDGLERRMQVCPPDCGVKEEVLLPGAHEWEWQFQLPVSYPLPGSSAKMVVLVSHEDSIFHQREP